MNYKRNNKALILFAVIIVILLIIYLKAGFRRVSTNNDIDAQLNDAIVSMFKEDEKIQEPEQLSAAIINALNEIGADFSTIGDHSIGYRIFDFSETWVSININNKDLIIRCGYKDNQWIVWGIQNRDTFIYYYTPNDICSEDIYSLKDDSLIRTAETTTEATTESTTIITTEMTTNINPLYNYPLNIKSIYSGIGNNIVGSRGYITIDKEEYNKIPGKYVYEFLDDQLNDCNYFNIFFTDGTGINSNFPSLLTYGELDPDGGISDINKQYTDLQYDYDKQIYK